MRRISVIICLAFLLPAGGCKKLLDIKPGKGIVETEVVFSSEPTAISALAGLYTQFSMNIFTSGGYFGVNALAGLSADELNYLQNETQVVAFERNLLGAENEYVEAYWIAIYKSIFTCNALLDGLSTTNAVSEPIKRHLRGEALFMRAFFHFYAVNLFGDVPLVTTADYKVNAIIGRTASADVYRQITADLIEAKELLSEGYVEGLNVASNIRARVNKFAVSALLARVYLYQEKWSDAEAEASAVIANNSLYELSENLNGVFIASTGTNNKEAIWQLEIPANTTYTPEALVFIVRDPATSYYRLSDTMCKSFEAGDERAVQWTGTSIVDPSIYYVHKYKRQNSSYPKEAVMVLRLAEQYLIRAEARARQNKLTGNNSAVSDIDVIRDRAGLPPTTATTLPQVIAAIEQERKVELFAEWGHRWLDLKRWGRAGAVLGPLKGADWQSTDVLYPIPQTDMDKNVNLKPQNPGYF